MDETQIACKGHNPDGEHEDHPAHVLLWQVGDVWVPSCSDRALDWWHDDATRATFEREAAGAPEQWIKPLPDDLGNPLSLNSAQRDVVAHYQGMTSEPMHWFVGPQRDDDSIEVIGLGQYDDREGEGWAWAIRIEANGDHHTSEAEVGQFSTGITV